MRLNQTLPGTVCAFTFFLLAAGGAGPNRAGGHPLDHWYARTSPEPYLQLSAVAYGGGQFVAVGAGMGFSTTNVLTSPDGANWTGRASGVSSRLNGITYGNGQFVAVGENVVMDSTDAVAWNSRAPMARLNAITFGQGYFVAVGEMGAGYAKIGRAHV